jgi:hypothetical protein
VAKPIPTANCIIASSAVKLVCHADTTENASTAASAPMGSFTIASHCSKAAGAFGQASGAQQGGNNRRTRHDHDAAKDCGTFPAQPRAIAQRQ